MQNSSFFQMSKEYKVLYNTVGQEAYIIPEEIVIFDEPAFSHILVFNKRTNETRILFRTKEAQAQTVATHKRINSLLF